MGHAYLVPIIIGSYWFSLKGGLITSLLAGLLFAPHIPFQFRDVEMEKFIELFVYAAIGAITGLLSGKLHRQAEEIYEAEERLHAADRLASIGELAASVAHEVRNPLGSIKGAVEILSDDFPPGHEKREFFEIIGKEIARINRIVEEFLGMARTRAGNRVPLALAEVIRSVVFLITFKARKRRVEIQMDVPAALRVTCDPDRLKQVFLNLILNAMDAMENDGGTIRVSARAGEGRITIEIADDGPGIPADIRDKMFSPFFTTKSGGTGLGLSIASRIVRENGGTIEVLGREPSGTIMRIVFAEMEKRG